MGDTKIELYHDNFQNFRRYDIPKAQLVIADIPYNIGANAYASNPVWYQGGDNKNGESQKAKSSFFHTDGNFKIAEYMHFCSRLLKPEPKEKGKAPAMVVFCAFDQIQTVIEYGKQYGFQNSFPLFFCKNYSAQVLKANMRIVGATEFAVVLYRDKLPKFNNGREIDLETQIPAPEVWKAIGQKPLFGHHSGKKMGTFWACFMKLEYTHGEVEKALKERENNA